MFKIIRYIISSFNLKLVFLVIKLLIIYGSNIMFEFIIGIMFKRFKRRFIIKK